MSLQRLSVLFGLGVSLLALNALFGFVNRWPGVGVVPDLRVSAELALLVLLLALWVRRRAGLSPRATAWLAAWACIGVLVRYADVTSRALLGRPVNLYWDGQHAWQLLRMAGAEQNWDKLVGALLGSVVVIGLLFLLLRKLFSLLGQGLGHARVTRPAAVAGLALSLLWLLAPQLGAPVQRIFAEPISGTVVQQVRTLARSLSPARAEALLPASPVFDADLSALQGADVLVLFVEAYGAITLDAAHIARALEPARETFARAIAGSGREVVSARVVSPTFGGASWLAHAALLSGIDTREPDTYAALLGSRRPSLVGHFAANGYRTVAWVPGIQRPWPEGRFWGFDRYGELDTLGYRGRAFGYWQVPDQAAMALLERDELSADARIARPGPRFIVFPTVSSHAPFVPIAPFRSDWAALVGTGAYSEAELARALATPENWTQPTPHYVDALLYTFEWLSSFVAERADPSLVLIVIGDHQPIGAVTGPGAPWDVPVHVVGGNAELLARLRAQGFVDGLRPGARPLGPMHELTQLLVRSFGDAGASGPPDVRLKPDPR